MSQNDYFPEWLEAELDSFQEFLSEETLAHLYEFREEYKKLGAQLAPLSTEEQLGEILKINPDDLMQIFPDVYTAMVHVSELLIARWYFTHAYKIRSSYDGMHYALSKGDFLLSSVCGRGIFEEVVHFSYYLNRLVDKTEYINNLSGHAENKIKKGAQPDQGFETKTITAFTEIFQLLEKSLQGSDFNWKAWIKMVADRYGSENLHQEVLKLRAPKSRKTHMHKLVKDFEKKTALEASFYYDLLSEMVHPNGGSNKLVISTRYGIDDSRGNITLSATPKNVEAAAFFFECFGKVFADIFSHAENDLNKASSIYQYFRNWAERLGDQNIRNTLT